MILSQILTVIKITKVSIFTETCHFENIEMDREKGEEGVHIPYG